MNRLGGIELTRRSFSATVSAVAVANGISATLAPSLLAAAATALGKTMNTEDDIPLTDFIAIEEHITLRRMLARNETPKGTVLFLHGFPETLYAWRAVTDVLAAEYEVHAFDWPGYGLSSRPSADLFSYSPKDYARVLDGYINRAGIDRSTLTIYATDIGALPVLLLALESPKVAKTIIVGDFAPFDRLQHMYESLKQLKTRANALQARLQLNANRDDILENVFTRGLPTTARYEISPQFKADIARGWDYGAMTTADAFAHYYANFTRDQEYFEKHLDRLKTTTKVVWGEQDLFINKAMGIEFADKIKAPLTLLPGIGHYPHLQSPQHVIDEVRASFN